MCQEPPASCARYRHRSWPESAHAACHERQCGQIIKLCCSVSTRERESFSLTLRRRYSYQAKCMEDGDISFARLEKVADLVPRSFTGLDMQRLAVLIACRRRTVRCKQQMVSPHRKQSVEVAFREERRQTVYIHENCRRNVS